MAVFLPKKDHRFLEQVDDTGYCVLTENCLSSGFRWL